MPEMLQAPAAMAPTAIVWAEPGEADPEELIRVLGTGGIQVVLVGNAYMAAAEVCRLHRGRGGRSGHAGRGTGREPGEMLRLVIVGPGDGPRAAAVCEALAKYAPEAPCWVYGPTGSPRLRPVTEADVAGWGGAAAAPREPSRAGDVAFRGGGKGSSGAPQVIDRTRFSHTAAPQLRLAGSGHLPPKPADPIADQIGEGAEGAGDDARPLLTPEELEMLLGDADGAGR